MRFGHLPIGAYFRLESKPFAVFKKIAYDTSTFKDDNVGHNAICYMVENQTRELVMVLQSKDVTTCDNSGVPQTYYQPYTLNNIPLEKLKNTIIRHRHVNKTFQIDNVYLSGFVGSGNIIIDFQKLVNEYVFPNGEPCGTKVLPC